LIKREGKSLIVSGPYGGLNYGDDAIALEICSQLRKRGFNVVLSVNDVAGAKEIYKDIPIVERLDLRRGRISSLRAIQECDGIIIGGGEQLSEPRIPNPIWGHLATNFQICLLSAVLKKKCALLGVGVDSRISILGKILLFCMLRLVDFIGVRDLDSLVRLKKLLRPKDPVYLGADPVFLSDPIPKIQARHVLSDRFGISPDTKIVLIMPSIDKINKTNYLDEINIAVKKLVTEGIRVFYAISDTQDTYDRSLFNDNKLYLSEGSTWINPKDCSLNDLRALVAAADCVVSSRMHPIIFSLINRTPFVCLARSAKMTALMKMLNLRDYLELNMFSSDELLKEIRSRISSGSDEYYSSIDENLDLLKSRASIQFDSMVNALHIS